MVPVHGLNSLDRCSQDLKLLSHDLYDLSVSKSERGLVGMLSFHFEKILGKVQND